MKMLKQVYRHRVQTCDFSDRFISFQSESKLLNLSESLKAILVPQGQAEQAKSRSQIRTPLDSNKKKKHIGHLNHHLSRSVSGYEWLSSPSGRVQSTPWPPTARPASRSPLSRASTSGGTPPRCRWALCYRTSASGTPTPFLR